MVKIENLPEYLYPTEPIWFPKLIAAWQESNLEWFAFPFFDFEVHTLPNFGEQHFWLNMYYTATNTSDPNLQRKVLFRALIERYGTTRFSAPDVFERLDHIEKAKTWFLTRHVEGICGLNGEALTDKAFVHAENKLLLSTIRSSIAPVLRTQPLRVKTKFVFESDLA